MANSILSNQGASSNSSGGNAPMLQQMQQMAQSINPQDAKARVEQMLRSGQINQVQLNQALQMARGIQGFFRR